MCVCVCVCVCYRLPDTCVFRAPPTTFVPLRLTCMTRLAWLDWTGLDWTGLDWTGLQEWDRRGKPGGSFFTWLSTPEVQLDGCPRHELESDVVHYCRPEERDNYALSLEVTREVCIM